MATVNTRIAFFICIQVSHRILKGPVLDGNALEEEAARKVADEEDAAKKTF